MKVLSCLQHNPFSLSPSCILTVPLIVNKTTTMFLKISIYESKRPSIFWDGTKVDASLPYEYGGIVYLWKCLDELYHKLPFISILIFSFLALYKACKGTRKEFTRRETARTGLQILFTMSPKSLQLLSYLDANFKSIKKLKV